MLTMSCLKVGRLTSYSGSHSGAQTEGIAVSSRIAWATFKKKVEEKEGRKGEKKRRERRQRDGEN